MKAKRYATPQLPGPFEASLLPFHEWKSPSSCAKHADPRIFGLCLAFNHGFGLRSVNLESFWIAESYCFHLLVGVWTCSWLGVILQFWHVLALAKGLVRFSFRFFKKIKASYKHFQVLGLQIPKLRRYFGVFLGG